MDPILPKLAECEWHATLPFEEFQARLAALGGLIADSKIKPVKFSCSDGVVRVETENDGHGRAVTCFASTAMDGEFSPFGVNATYLQAMLKPYVADAVTISGSSPVHPLRLTIPGLEHIAMVVMPLRIEW
jgi:DNA polymerase III sliding clamp (beta) subunit (PCNA family)